VLSPQRKVFKGSQVVKGFKIFKEKTPMAEKTQENFTDQTCFIGLDVHKSRSAT
jgi:hypothetical protein